MKINYLNYRQAEAIAKDFQYLKGHPFNSDNTTDEVVDHIYMAPYSRILQFQFMQAIQKGIAKEEALSICRNDRYDVIVLSNKAFDEHPYRIKSLRDYLREHNIEVNSAIYRASTTNFFATKQSMAAKQPKKVNIDLLNIDTLINSMREPVIILNTSFHVMAWNTECELSFGQTSKDVMGVPYFSIFPEEENNQKMNSTLQQVLKGYNCFLPAEECNSSQGSYDHYFSPLKEDGDLIAILLIKHDISHRLKIINKLNTANETLVRKNEELTKLNVLLKNACINIGQQLHEPLGKISNFARLILLDEDAHFKAPTKEYATRIKKLSEETGNFADNLLRYVAYDDALVNAREVELDSLLQFIKNDLRVELAMVNGNLKWTGLPKVMADQNMLVEMFVELVRNALKFRSADTDPQITVTAQTEQTETTVSGGKTIQSACIKITDNGIGIDERYREDIFQLFYKAPDAKETPGYGVGLALCRKIAEKHGGSIKVERSKEGGSVFICSLPLAGSN